MALTEAQQTLTTLLESSLEDEIDGIGEPRLDDSDRIIVDFQYGDEVYTATIDPEKGEIKY